MIKNSKSKKPFKLNLSNPVKAVLSRQYISLLVQGSIVVFLYSIKANRITSFFIYLQYLSRGNPSTLRVPSLPYFGLRTCPSNIGH